MWDYMYIWRVSLEYCLCGPRYICANLAFSAGRVSSHLSTHVLTSSQHYGDVIMGAMASQITSLTIVYSTVYSDADQRKHQSSASLAFVWGIHRGPVNSPHKWPVTRKMFPFDDVSINAVRFEQSSRLVWKMSFYHPKYLVQGTLKQGIRDGIWLQERQ